MSSSEKKITTTRFGESWKCRLTGWFHGEFAGGEWRAGHGGAVGEFWWAAMQREHARARRSELVTATPLRPRFWRERGRKEEMDASTSPEVSPWRSCGRPELTSGARDDVQVPNVAVDLTPVGHVDELGFHSDKAMVD